VDDGKQGAVASVPREPAVVFSTLGLDTLTLPWLVASRTNARQHKLARSNSGPV
jgi:hypothetical protein